MRLGFIGTGAITEAMIEGFVTVGGFADPIMVSERSKERSARLAARHENITVSPDNQAIVDGSDWVFLAPLPVQAIEVASALTFRADQRIISAVAGIRLETWAPVLAPATDIHRVVPLPPIERGLGPTAICPPDPGVEALFASTGTAVAVDDERQFQALAVATSLMACFFETVATSANWLENEGVPDAQAAAYASSMFQALASLATQEDAAGLRTMADDCLTAGGVNEQVLYELREAGWFDTYRKRLDRIMERFDGA